MPKIAQSPQEWKKNRDIDNSKSFDIDMVPGDIDGLELDQSDVDIFRNPELKRTFYFYKMTSLFKKTGQNGFKLGQNALKLGFIDTKLGQAIEGIEVSNKVMMIEQQPSTDPGDTSINYVMKDDKQIIIQTRIDNYSVNDLFVCTINEELTESNKNDIYLVILYNEPYGSNKVTIELSITKLSDYRTRDGNSIIPILHEQIDDQTITSITIKSDKPTFYGNIKVFDDMGSQELKLSDDQCAFPLLLMPIQTEPENVFLDFWSSINLVLPWNEKNSGISLSSFVFDENNMQNTDGDISQLISFDNPTVNKLITFKNCVVNNNVIFTSHKDVPADGDYTDPVNFDNNKKWNLLEHTTHIDPSTGDLDVDVYTYARFEDRFKDVVLEFKEYIEHGTLYDLLKLMLEYNFMYKNRFPDSKYDDQGKPSNQSARFKEIFAGQKPEDVIWDLYLQWKLKNPKYVDSYQAKNFERILIMLSNEIICSGCVNSGLNDDAKILLPYYFKLISAALYDSDKGEVSYSDIRVILKSEYFKFNIESKIIYDVIYNKFNLQQWFKLTQNQFCYPEIYDKLQANNIPSLLPKDISLSNGEFHKYFCKLVINKLDLMKAINLIANGNEWINNNELITKYKLLSNNNIMLKCNFLNIEQIYISSINLNGNYIISLLNSNIIFKIKSNNSLVKIST